MGRNLRSWIPILAVAITIGVLLVVWYVTFPASAWIDTPNYFLMYLEFIVSRPVEAFLTVSTGPGSVAAWVFIPVYLLIVAHIVLYFVGKRMKQQYTVISRAYLV